MWNDTLYYHWFSNCEFCGEMAHGVWVTGPPVFRMYVHNIMPHLLPECIIIKLPISFESVWPYIAV